MSRFRNAATGMTLSEHLAEARHRFMISAVAVALFAVLAFVYYPPILHVLQKPYCAANTRNCRFLVTNPLDGITLRVKIAFFGGFLIASPVLFWQAWRFITPGLKARERRYAIPFVATSIAFFVAGVALAYFSFAHALRFLQAIGGHQLVTIYNPNQYLTLFLLVMFVFGISFEFPVVLVAVQLAGLVTPKKLLHWWRYAIALIVIVAGIITPSPDPLSMFILAIPLIIFYFLAIAVGKLLRR